MITNLLCDDIESLKNLLRDKKEINQLLILCGNNYSVVFASYIECIDEMFQFEALSSNYALSDINKFIVLEF